MLLNFDFGGEAAARRPHIWVGACFYDSRTSRMYIIEHIDIITAKLLPFSGQFWHLDSKYLDPGYRWFIFTPQQRMYVELKAVGFSSLLSKCRWVVRLREDSIPLPKFSYWVSNLSRKKKKRSFRSDKNGKDKYHRKICITEIFLSLN